MTKDGYKHNGCFEYITGKPYAVFTYAVAMVELNEDPLYHLYAAFIKLSGGHVFKGAKSGERVVKYYRPNASKRKSINDLLDIEDKMFDLIGPRDIYEGADLSHALFDPPNGFCIPFSGICRLKEYMPEDYDAADVVFSIARYDGVYAPGLMKADPYGSRFETILEHRREYVEKEREAYSDRDHYKENYRSLQTLIDNWLSGRVSAKHIERFMKKSEFCTVDKYKDLSVMCHTDLYSVEYTASARHCENIISDKKTMPDNRYSISNGFIDENGRMTWLDYYVDSAPYVSRWAVKMLKGQDISDLEQSTKLRIKSRDLTDYVYGYVDRAGFKMNRECLECYDPVNDIRCNDVETIDIPAKVVARFRESGKLMEFDPESFEKKRMAHGMCRLMGRAEIEKYDVDYDPDEYKAVSIFIHYKPKDKTV